MKRVLLLLAIALTGCGGTVFQVNTLPANAVTFTGFVSIVRLTAIVDANGSLVNVTVVTLQQSGPAQTFTFCGQQSGQFPLDQTLRVSFVPANPCANLIAVVHL